MYLLSKFYSDFIRLHVIIILSFLLFLLLFNIWFPHEAFAMEPNITIDYYGQEEYTGPDAYGYFHDSNVSPEIDTHIIQRSRRDLYNTSPIYVNNKSGVISSTGPNNSTFVFYLSVKRKAYWYIWKRYSTNYDTYKDFKQDWNPNNSVRKEIFKDIKNAFIKRK